MIVLKRSTKEDIQYISTVDNQEVTEEEIEFYATECKCVTFFDTDTENPVAIGISHSNGEIGLLLDNDNLKGKIKNFYTMLVVFVTCVFHELDDYNLPLRVYTGIRPTFRDLRWITFLGFSQCATEPEHENRGWRTFDLEFSRWFHE